MCFMLNILFIFSLFLQLYTYLTALFLVKFITSQCPAFTLRENFCSTFARCNYYRELSLGSVSTFSQLQKAPLSLRHAILITFIRGFAHSQGAFSWSSTTAGDTSARSSFPTLFDLLYFTKTFLMFLRLIILTIPSVSVFFLSDS